MPRLRQHTIRINQGYRIDSTWEGLALTGRCLAWLVRLGWRWRTEFGLCLALLAVRLFAGRLVLPAPALGTTALVAAAMLAWAPSRAMVLGRLGCARTR